jgi:hypothetical protein
LSRTGIHAADHLFAKRIVGNLIMNSDSINDEILRIKRELAEKFDNNLERIVADTKSRERNTLTLPPRRWLPEPGAATPAYRACDPKPY